MGVATTPLPITPVALRSIKRVSGPNNHQQVIPNSLRITIPKSTTASFGAENVRAIPQKRWDSPKYPIRYTPAPAPPRRFSANSHLPAAPLKIFLHLRNMPRLDPLSAPVAENTNRRYKAKPSCQNDDRRNAFTLRLSLASFFRLLRRRRPTRVLINFRRYGGWVWRGALRGRCQRRGFPLSAALQRRRHSHTDSHT